MRATWWWIDRWRKSTAYTDMTLEEQGAYRNLCDEVVLRDDGVIPEASIGRAAGDAAAWERVGPRVLQWMHKVPGGWTNDTALEVKAKSEQLSKKQSDRAKSGWSKRCRKDAVAYATAMPQTMHETMPPSPSPLLPTYLHTPVDHPILPDEEKAERATKATIQGLQAKLGSLIARLAEHPNSRRMVPDWSREVTSYTRQDGTKVRGQPDYRCVSSIDRLERSIEDAEWWLEELEKPDGQR